MSRRLRRRLPASAVPLALAALLGVAGGGVLRLMDEAGAADLAWAATTALLLVPLTASVLRSLARRDVGVDAIALVSMAGALALGEYLAGAVVALMLAGGNALEARAAGRAKRELRLLVERAPRVALVHRGRRLVEVPVESVRPGDVVLVRGGEVVPVDGILASDEAAVDESALTGEPLPVTFRRGDPIRSGTASAGPAFHVRAERAAAESAYAGVVRLAERAQHERAPFVRLADRYAALFLPLTAFVAGAAWLASGDPVRALAVFVVATPCPLILAAPIAFLSGLSRAARIGIVVKGGGALERLGEAHTVLLDKTGTLTVGRPTLAGVVASDGYTADELLRLAASVDRLSAHPLAGTIVAAAESRRLPLSTARDVAESFGSGVAGVVDGHRVVVGSRGWLREHGVDADAAADPAGETRIHVAVDGVAAGRLVVDDRLREGAATLVPRLHAAGVSHVALVTGDHVANAAAVAAQLGLDSVVADCTPAAKLDVVRSLRAQPEREKVVMVGDGVNDAPALALADVGIALGTAGATVASETADVVVLVDDVGRVADAIGIGRRSLAIARQSVLLGLGASGVAMGFAALGYLPPVAGALVQEVIDVAVILNALRALRG